MGARLVCVFGLSFFIIGTIFSGELRGCRGGGGLKYMNVPIVKRSWLAVAPILRGILDYLCTVWLKTVKFCGLRVSLSPSIFLVVQLKIIIYNMLSMYLLINEVVACTHDENHLSHSINYVEDLSHKAFIQQIQLINWQNHHPSRSLTKIVQFCGHRSFKYDSENNPQ